MSRKQKPTPNAATPEPDKPAVDDSSLFRDAVGEVKPVSNNRRIPDTPKVAPQVNYQAPVSYTHLTLPTTPYV